MRKVSIDARDKTPSVILDKENSRIEIRGYSFPDEAHDFYAEIVVWFKEYAKNPNPETKVVFDFNYVNSTSAKFINDILKKLDGIVANGKNACVEWLFEPDDEDIQQLGNTLKEFHKVPFTVSVKNAAKDPGKKKMF